MRVVGIVTELKGVPGLYARETTEVKNLLEKLSPADKQKWIAGLTLVGHVTVAGAIALAAAAAAVAYGGGWFSKPAPIRPLSGLHLPGAEQALERAIVIPANLLCGEYSDYNAPVFHGLFRSKSELASLMDSEGKNVDLFLVDQAYASERFKNFTGGPFSPGIHLPHPKDPRMLVNLRGVGGRTMAEALLHEVHQEWVRTFEALGAKRIVIADATAWKGTFKGDRGDVAGEMKAAYGQGRLDESTFGPGTFDPERATSGRRWIRDYPEIMSVVDGRTHGTQTSWRRSVKVNAAFGLGVDVLKVWKLGFEGDYQRTFDFFVEFYSRQ